MYLSDEGLRGSVGANRRPTSAQRSAGGEDSHSIGSPLGPGEARPISATGVGTGLPGPRRSVRRLA